MTATTTSAPLTATRPRALAPDLSRGMMLLFIAVANVSWFLNGPTRTVTVAFHGHFSRFADMVQV